MEASPEADEILRFRATIRAGLTQADRGELIDDEEVLRWLELQEHS